MNPRLQNALTFLLVLGAGLGGYWWGRGSAAGATAAAHRTDVTKTEERESPRDVNARLAAEEAQRTMTPAAVERAAALAVAGGASGAVGSPWRDQMNTLAQVQREKLANVRVPFLGRDGRLTDGFAKLFGLSEGERQGLQQALDQGRKRTDELIAAGTTVKQEGDTLVVAMKPFEGGGDVYDALMESFAQILGPERNAAFLALQTDQLANAFNGFGAEQRTVSFAREAAADGGMPRILVRDQKKASGSSSMSSMQITDLDRLPEQYRWLAPYFPQISALPVRSRAAPPAGVDGPRL